MMSAALRRNEALALLRKSIGNVPVDDTAVLPFGVDAMDQRLADGGLALGALHEISPAVLSV